MRVHLLTAPGILVMWAVTYPSTSRAQRCLTLVIKWVSVYPTWQDAVVLEKVWFQMTIELINWEF
jgi:hypothetical protein